MFRRRNQSRASPQSLLAAPLPLIGCSPSNATIVKWIAIFACATCYTWYYRGWLVLHRSNLYDLTTTTKVIPPSDTRYPKQQTVSSSPFVVPSRTKESAISNRKDGRISKDVYTRDNDKNIAAAGAAADPTSLRKGIAAFVSNQTFVQYDEHNITTLLYSQPRLYWKLLEYYAPMKCDNDTTTLVLHSPEYTCALGPGRGFEQDYGYRLLSEKIRISNHGTTNSSNEKSMPRILCLIYTHSKMQHLQRTQALTWGWQCNGYLAFSTETLPSLGVVNLTHKGDESYNNMWQKVRSIWMYVYTHYHGDYDFFHMGGDDLYLLVANLQMFLLPYMNRTDAIYLGQWIPLPGGNDDTFYVSGGPGYTLNQVALKRLVTEALPSCRIHTRASYEDRLVSHCFRELNITGQDTRNIDTGEQLYHDVGPEHLYTFRSTTGRGSFHAKSAAYWERLPFPNNTTEIVGPKHELQAADTYSVSFHDIYHPLYMARLHSILYPQTCPSTTPLGRALRIQSDCPLSFG